MAKKQEKKLEKVSNLTKASRKKISESTKESHSSTRKKVSPKNLSEKTVLNKKKEAGTKPDRLKEMQAHIAELQEKIKALQEKELQKQEEENVVPHNQNQELLKKIVNSSITDARASDKVHTDVIAGLDTESEPTGAEEVPVKRRKRRKNKVKTWEEKAKKLPTFEVSNYPKLPVKNILITQNKPSDLQNPYQFLEDKYKVKVHFRPFIKVEGLTAQEFRNQRVDVHEYKGIIFTSRLAIDHFFRLLNEMRISLSDSTKFFCLNEQIAYYMQKYMELRKRKILWGQGPVDDLKNVLKKNAGGKFLLPASDTIKEKIIGILDELKAPYTTVDVYKTVPENIQDLKPGQYDMMVFFTPIAVEALHKYFPKLKQGKTRFAAYSILTANKLHELGYRIDIFAPTLEFPSMVNAIAHYLLHTGEK